MIGKKKIAAAVIGVVVVSAVAVTGVLVYNKSAGTEETLGENQSYVYAYVSKIQGNELTYMTLDETVVSAYLSQTDEEDSDATDGGGDGETGGGDGETGGEWERGTETGENEERAARTQGRQEEQNTESGESGFDMTGGGMPDGMTEGEMPDADMTEGGMSDGVSRGDSWGTESVTTLIPVSTTVHTSTDTETTFQRLAAGDLLKLLVEENEDGEEVIIEIWML